MSLAERITNDMKAAMKSKNNATLSTLRLLRSAVKNKQIDVQHELSDEEIQAVIKTQVKQLNDAIATYTAAGREEMAASGRAEIVVLEQYLPTKMSEEALEQLVSQVIEQTGATSKADTGKVMGAAVKAVAGQADGARIKTVVDRLLPMFILVVLGVGSASQVFAAIDLLPEQLTYYPILETALRVFRVLILWFGLMAINKILHGGFVFSVASMRDNTHQAAWSEIGKGFFGTIAVVLLYSVATIAIEVIS